MGGERKRSSEEDDFWNEYQSFYNAKKLAPPTTNADLYNLYRGIERYRGMVPVLKKRKMAEIARTMRGYSPALGSAASFVHSTFVHCLFDFFNHKHPEFAAPVHVLDQFRAGKGKDREGPYSATTTPLTTDIVPRDTRDGDGDVTEDVLAEGFTLNHDFPVYGVSVTADGRYALTVVKASRKIGVQLRLWELDESSGTAVAVLLPPDSATEPVPDAVVITADGDGALVGFLDGSVVAWDGLLSPRPRRSRASDTSQTDRSSVSRLMFEKIIPTEGKLSTLAASLDAGATSANPEIEAPLMVAVGSEDGNVSLVYNPLQEEEAPRVDVILSGKSREDAHPVTCVQFGRLPLKEGEEESTDILFACAGPDVWVWTVTWDGDTTPYRLFTHDTQIERAVWLGRGVIISASSSVQLYVCDLIETGDAPGEPQRKPALPAGSDPGVDDDEAMADEDTGAKPRPQEGPAVDDAAELLHFGANADQSLKLANGAEGKETSDADGCSIPAEGAAASRQNPEEPPEESFVDAKPVFLRRGTPPGAGSFSLTTIAAVPDDPVRGCQGSRVLIGTQGTLNHVQLWNIDEGTTEGWHHAHKKPIRSISCSRKTWRVVSAAEDGLAMIWQLFACTCGLPHAGQTKGGIMCDECQRWYHDLCVSSQTAPSDDSWLCLFCKHPPSQNADFASTRRGRPKKESLRSGATDAEEEDDCGEEEERPDQSPSQRSISRMSMRTRPKRTRGGDEDLESAPDTKRRRVSTGSGRPSLGGATAATAVSVGSARPSSVDAEEANAPAEEETDFNIPGISTCNMYRVFKAPLLYPDRLPDHPESKLLVSSFQRCMADLQSVCSMYRAVTSGRTYRDKSLHPAEVLERAAVLLSERRSRVLSELRRPTREFPDVQLLENSEMLAVLQEETEILLAEIARLEDRNTRAKFDQEERRLLLESLRATHSRNHKLIQQYLERVPSLQKAVAKQKKTADALTDKADEVDAAVDELGALRMLLVHPSLPASVADTDMVKSVFLFDDSALTNTGGFELCVTVGHGVHRGRATALKRALTDVEVDAVVQCLPTKFVSRAAQATLDAVCSYLPLVHSLSYVRSLKSAAEVALTSGSPTTTPSTALVPGDSSGCQVGNGQAPGGPADVAAGEGKAELVKEELGVDLGLVESDDEDDLTASATASLASYLLGAACVCEAVDTIANGNGCTVFCGVTDPGRHIPFDGVAALPDSSDEDAAGEGAPPSSKETKDRKELAVNNLALAAVYASHVRRFERVAVLDLDFNTPVSSAVPSIVQGKGFNPEVLYLSVRLGGEEQQRCTSLRQCSCFTLSAESAADATMLSSLRRTVATDVASALSAFSPDLLICMPWLELTEDEGGDAKMGEGSGVETEAGAGTGAGAGAGAGHRRGGLFDLGRDLADLAHRTSGGKLLLVVECGSGRPSCGPAQYQRNAEALIAGTIGLNAEAGR
eukprot:Rmarinus@m.24498